MRPREGIRRIRPVSRETVSSGGVPGRAQTATGRWLGSPRQRVEERSVDRIVQGLGEARGNELIGRSIGLWPRECRPLVGPAAPRTSQFTTRSNALRHKWWISVIPPPAHATGDPQSQESRVPRLPGKPATSTSAFLIARELVCLFCTLSGYYARTDASNLLLVAPVRGQRIS